LAFNVPLVVVQMISIYSTVQKAVYSVDYGHLKSLDLPTESKTFRLRGPGLGI